MGGPASAAPAVPVPSIHHNNNSNNNNNDINPYHDELDDIDQHVYALSIESQEFTVADHPQQQYQQQTNNGLSAHNSDLRNSPIPSRSNSNPRNNFKAGGSNYSSSPPSRVGTPPVLADLRRVGSNNSGKMGLSREDSVRSAASGGSGGSLGNHGMYQQPNGNHSNGYMNGTSEGTYLDEPVYAGLRDKVRKQNKEKKKKKTMFQALTLLWMCRILTDGSLFFFFPTIDELVASQVPLC